MSTDLDIRQLAIERPRAGISLPARRTHWISRYAIPGFILLGFVALLAWALRDQWQTRKSVTVVPVIVTRAEVQQNGTPLFQAAGWIEPKPFPISITAMADGMISEINVVEGQEVTQGQIVAKLFDTDAKLAAREANAKLELCAADLLSAEAEFQAAKQRKEKPLHLDAAINEALAVLAKLETDLAKLPFQKDSVKARYDFLKDSFERKVGVGEGIAHTVVLQAKHDLAIAETELKEIEQREPHLKNEVQALRQRGEALKQQKILLIDETKQVSEAEAKVKACQARKSQAEVFVEQANLFLSRMEIKSPRSGRVLKLVSQPGTRVGGVAGAMRANEGTIITLYDPRSLQVRADVRLEDVGQVLPGQIVRIETGSLKEALKGTVLQTTSVANIQKNTLEVKVSIDNPPNVIRPEMLVATTFLAPEVDASKSRSSQSQERILVMKSLVRQGEDGPTVWIADAQGHARRKKIQLGKASKDNLVEVTEGLLPTDKLVSGGREALQDGDRIQISAEDDT